MSFVFGEIITNWLFQIHNRHEIRFLTFIKAFWRKNIRRFSSGSNLNKSQKTSIRSLICSHYKHTMSDDKIWSLFVKYVKPQSVWWMIMICFVSNNTWLQTSERIASRIRPPPTIITRIENQISSMIGYYHFEWWMLDQVVIPTFDRHPNVRQYNR